MQDRELEKKLRETRLWAYLGDQENPYVVFDFTKSRKRDGPANFLKGYKGYLQADAFAGYDCIFAGGEVTEVACMAHVRRKFFEAQSSSKEAQQALAIIQELYLIEKEVKEMENEKRREIRRVKSEPLLENLKPGWIESDWSRCPRAQSEKQRCTRSTIGRRSIVSSKTESLQSTTTELKMLCAKSQSEERTGYF